LARINCLVDTDVLIDWLKGQSWAKEALWSGDKRLYCSSVTRKELLSKPGLSARERERILRLLRHVRVLNVDGGIAAAASELLQKYAGAYPLHTNDALVAATAWMKRMPLLTRNRKHYEFIAEIELFDIHRDQE
jgi:tRNA(fMet)-specific endonuclease VapC